MYPLVKSTETFFTPLSNVSSLCFAIHLILFSFFFILKDIYTTTLTITDVKFALELLQLAEMYRLNQLKEEIIDYVLCEIKVSPPSFLHPLHPIFPPHLPLRRVKYLPSSYATAFLSYTFRKKFGKNHFLPQDL